MIDVGQLKARQLTEDGWREGYWHGFVCGGLICAGAAALITLVIVMLVRTSAPEGGGGSGGNSPAIYREI